MWSGRCARSWCDGDGVVRVDFDGEARRVWIADAREGRMAPALVLCRRHAAALTPPLNWELHDLRPDPADSSNAAGAVTAPAPETARDAGVVPVGAARRAATGPGPARDRPAIRSRPLPAAPAVPAPAPVPALLDRDRRDATGWLPRFDRADDLGGVLDAHSPLLARAFASVHDRS